MLKVLLVDDEPFILQGLSVIIDWAAEGFEIIDCASNAMDALEVIEKEQPQLVISDVKMPQMSGLCMIEKVRKEKLSNPYFVLLSGYSDFEYAKKAIQNECLDYMVKPVNRIELLSVLKRVREKEKEENRTSGVEKTQSVYKMQDSDMEFADESKRKLSVKGTEEFSGALDLRGNQVILGQIEIFLRENYKQNITLKDLAKKYYMNAAYLGQLFRKQYGEAFKDYLNRVRIEKAKELLIHTDYKIYEIADETGYKDVDYFINKFISLNGCTPTKYRKYKNK